MLAVLPIGELAEVPASFEFAKEATTQLLTMGTAAIAVALTFAKEWREQGQSRSGWAMKVTWIGFTISVIAGIWTLGAMSGTLATSVNVAADHVYNSNIKFASITQMVTFIIGVVSLVVHALRHL
jgi:hypothetical protein